MHSKKQLSSIELTLTVVIGLSLVYFLGALSSALLFQWLEGSETALEASLLRKGPGKLMRRCATLWAIPFVIYLFRRLNWGGWSDAGFTIPPAPFDRKKTAHTVGRSFVLGMLSLGAAVTVMFLLGTREFVEFTKAAVLLHALRVTFQCIAVSILEETLARGILFRTVSRIWGCWPAAIFLSLLTGVMHFMEPAASAYQGESVMQDTLNSLGSLLTSIGRTPELPLRVVNLTLMGLALSAAVIRTRTIWVAAGLHAGWVWIKLMNGFSSNTSKTVEAPLWLGNRSDATDGLLCSVMLISFLLIFAITTPKALRSKSL